ncbi:MAG: MFS transporter [Zavarzinella sp.]
MIAGSHGPRLAVMMFVQYFALGAWIVPLGTFLRTSATSGGMSFSPSEVAWIYNSSAIAALIAPLLLGMLADHLFSAQKLLAILNLVGAGLVFYAGQICTLHQPLIAEAALVSAEAKSLAVKDAFQPLFITMLAYSMCNALILPLTNIVSYRHLANPTKWFGPVRMLGTLGWIAVSLSLDMFGKPFSPEPLYWASAVSLLMAVYAWTLPSTPPVGHGRGFREIMGIPALKLLRLNSFRVLLITIFILAGVQQFYVLYANSYLKDLHAAKPTSVQSLAQVSEVVCLLFMPLILGRFGFKWVLVFGIGCWVARNALFATLSLPIVAGFGLPMHGLCYGLFFIVANLYVDRKAPTHLRAMAQGMFAIVSSGLGQLFGGMLSSAVLSSLSHNDVVAWRWFWLIPAIMAAVMLIPFILFFKEETYFEGSHERQSTPPDDGNKLAPHLPATSDSPVKSVDEGVIVVQPKEQPSMVSETGRCVKECVPT